jgi:hypothetical protein
MCGGESPSSFIVLRPTAKTFLKQIEIAGVQTKRLFETGNP